METKSITTNRKAYYEYEILEKWEAGISLTGTEVKSIRDGRINLSDGWVEITDSVEATLRQVHISPYSHGNIYNHDPLRPRKLLLKKSELKKLLAAVGEKGLTVVPLSVYLKGQRVKIEIGLAKGKKLYDKRESTKEREAKRDIERAFKKR